MTLNDIAGRLPLAYDESLTLALVFGDQVAGMMAAAQEQHGSPWLRVAPVLLTDGRSMLAAELLTEVGPGGLLADWFAHLDASTFADIEVVPMADAVALIPPVPTPHA